MPPHRSADRRDPTDFRVRRASGSHFHDRADQLRHRKLDLGVHEGRAARPTILAKATFRIPPSAMHWAHLEPFRGRALS